jgi:hypothetical protein
LTIDDDPIVDPMFSQERTLSAAASSLFVLEEHWKAKAWQDTARHWGDSVYVDG